MLLLTASGCLYVRVSVCGYVDVVEVEAMDLLVVEVEQQVYDGVSCLLPRLLLCVCDVMVGG